MRKTENGFVDVTDAELDTDETQEGYEEALFEFPVFNEEVDDEELATLTPEEALALKKRREEEAAKRLAEYQELCKEGEEHLATGSFHAAELQFEKALWLQEEATEASVGYWRAKTADFTNPDVLADEYLQTGIDSLEEDVGYKATDIIRERYQAAFAGRIQELEAEEKPLAEEVESKQISRRAILKARIRKWSLYTLIAAVPTLVCLILGIIFGLKIPTIKEDTYIMPTIICAAAFIVCFIALLIVANKLINNLRMRRNNERLTGSEDGERLLEIRRYKKLYQALLPEHGAPIEEAQEPQEPQDE